MSSEATEVKGIGSRGRTGSGARRRAARGATLRRLALDVLEPRTLMAVLPPTAVSGAPNISGTQVNTVDVSNSQGNESAPSIAVDQNNPSKLAAVWTRNDPLLAPGPTEIVEYAVSNDGGKSWLKQGQPGGFTFPTTFDPTTSNPIVVYPQFSDASVAFDRNDNFYVLYSGHKTDNTSGTLLLSKYNFATGTAQPTFTNRAVYEWNAADAASDPILAVDDSLSSFTDTDANGLSRSQNDVNSGNVYVAWQSTDTAPAFGPQNFNPNRIVMVGSTDGGNSFSGFQIFNNEGNFGPNRNVTPRLAISQGAAPRSAGTNGANDPGSPGVSPGQVTVVWDDYGVGSKASPPFDVINSNRVTGANSEQQFSTNGGAIADAGAGTPNAPVTTDFPINVNVNDPRFVSLTDLTATVALTEANIAGLKIVLVPPTGSNLAPITLLNNQTDAAGNSNTFVGANGQNLGVIQANGLAVGTTFDDNATRNVVDLNNAGGRGAAAPFIGHFQPEGGSLIAAYRGAITGAPNSPNSVNGTWTLRFTNFRNGNPGFLRVGSIDLVSGLDPQVQTVVAHTYTRARQSGSQTASAAVAQGIAPAPVVASDNTLGAYSPHQGRLYVAFVDRFRFDQNPADNTNIYLATSDDGGVNWNNSNDPYEGADRPVNDDVAVRDGYSEGADPNGRFVESTGRPQFQPNVAVDNANGTLVMSWLDTRDDASRARVATYVTTSIDGGQTFSRDVYANDSQTATDAITNKVVVLAPIPDNQSGGNAEAVAGFGTRQGLAAYGGHLYPIWASNRNGGGDAKEVLDVRTDPMTYAAGPRITAVTMGPVGEPNDAINNQRGADGGPVASAFQVTFDRPVDPASFGTNDVVVRYRDATTGNVTGGDVPVNSVVPLDTGPFGATRFQVNFAPRSGVGTYSLEVTAADVRDRIRNVKAAVAPVGGRVGLTSPDVPRAVAPNGDVFATATVNSFPAGQVLSDVTVTVGITSPDASSLTLYLISPAGTRIRLADHEPFVNAGGQDYTNTTFDDRAARSITQGNAPFTGAFRPVSPLGQLAGQPLNGTWRLEVQSSLTPLTSTLNSFSLSFQPGQVTAVQVPGNKLDQNANATPGEAGDFFAAPTPLRGNRPFAGPFSQDTLPLVVPGPHVQSTRVPGQPSTPDNLVLNAPVSALDVTFDRDMDPATVTPAVVLRVMGPTGLIPGPYTVTANPNGSDPDPAHPRTYRLGFRTQVLSGTYTVKLASTAADSHGNALDENLNAGVDLLRGTSSGASASVVYNSNQPAAIAAGRTTVSTLNVPDDFVANGVTVQLDVTYPNDPDLQVTLVSPDNVPVVLVPQGTGTTGTHANFSGTIFDDAGDTVITNGGPPFFGRFKPVSPLSALNGAQTGGTWRLVVDSNPANRAGGGGSLNSWSLTFQKALPVSGLGEPVADQAALSFRVFTMDPTNRLSSTTWTSVGPASFVNPSANNGATHNGYAGRVGGIAVDPSDPSGNTVYVAGASGGVWKTNDFLTTAPKGPTYIPLTDFGPASGMNIGSIAVFPRNNDPRQTIVFAGTGDPDTTFNSFGVSGGNTNHGIGFLKSTDGGVSWQLLDSTNNNLPFGSRDHLFAQPNVFGQGTATMKLVADPRPTPDGQVIVYAAMKAPFSSNNGGLWRSVDTGQTWQKLSDNALGNASDVILDYTSATINAVSNPTGNVNVIYAAFPGHGVYISPNRGQVLNQMVGGTVDPLIYDTITQRAVPVNNGTNAPNGFPDEGRIVLARPDPLPATDPRADVANVLYQGYLYALVSDAFGHLDGIYMTKDNGQTWTKLRILNLPWSDPSLVPRRSVPSNDNNQVDYDILGSPIYAHGNYDMSIVVDPTDPNVVYVGGTANGKESGLIRVDASRVFDSHSVVSYDGTRNDGGTLQINSTGRAQVDDTIYGPSRFVGTSDRFSFASGPYLNLLADPTNPFQTNSTVFVRNVSAFTNDGTGVRWIPIDAMLKSKLRDPVPSSNVHRMVAIRDPLTGHARLIVGDDQGVFTGVLLPDGTLSPGVGTAVSPTYSRNGNLQIAQFYYGGAQPSSTALTGQIDSLFYGNGVNVGMVGSDPNVLNNGNIVGSGSTAGSPLGIIATTSGDQAGTGVGVDQQGRNIVYRYYWPTFGGNKTDFFQVSIGGGPFISRTSGLVQGANDPQWPGESPSYAFNDALGVAPGANAVTFGNFAVNPLNGDQVMISSNAGRIFATTNQGASWLSIGEPGALDGSYAPALTFGAPDPNGPGGIGNLNNFLYAGTTSGNIFVTRTGGGGTLNAWTMISTGLGGSPVEKILANPTRGSHEAYAVTERGVFHIADSTAPNASWTDITGNLFQITTPNFGNFQQSQPELNYLTSIQADWRYALPDDVNNPRSATHPLLYASGDAGVYRSLDNGATWSSFPDQAFDGAPADGGYLPHARVSDLNVSLGKVDPTTGRAVAQPGDPNVLLATTFGRGQFAIRLAPIVFPASVAFDTKLPAPTGSVNGTDTSGNPIVTVAQPVIDGVSEQTAFGNTVRISVIDLTDPANPRVIGGYDPSNPATDVPANRTDSFGKFQIQVNPDGFTSNGVKTIGIQATDASGTQGNVATLTFTLNAKLSTKTPPAVPTLGLNPQDDTSGGFNVTSKSTVHLVGASDPGVTVNLYLSSGGNPTGAPIGTATTDALGNYSILDANLADGTYTVQARAVNTFGTSAPSRPFTFTVKKTAPTTVPTLALSPADDTGIKGDNVTANHTPHFVGTADPNAKLNLYRLNAQGVPLPDGPYTVFADASGNFTAQLPLALNNGTTSLAVQEADLAGNLGKFSRPLALTEVTVLGDYTGVGRTTPAVYRRGPNGNALFFLQGVPPAGGIQFGDSNLDIPFTGDFDGDGKADLAIFRPGNNYWGIDKTRDGFTAFPLGSPGSLPAVGDFDGDGVADPAVYDPSTGTWTVATSSAGTQTFVMPSGGFTPRAGDVPVPGNYDNNGRDEEAVYRPGTGQFFIAAPGAASVRTVTLSTGAPGDVPVPGDYDNTATSRATVPAVFNPSTGDYLVLGHQAVKFQPGDIPAPGDYRGVGRTQVAVYRRSAGAFVIAGDPNPIFYGGASDVPLTAPLVYRTIVSGPPTLALAPASDTGVRGDGLTSARRPFFTGRTDPNALIDLIDANTGRVLGTGSADATGAFRVQASPGADLPNGVLTVEARAHGIVSNQGPLSPPVTVKLVTVDGDFLGTGRAQPSLFRRSGASAIQWYVQGDSAVFGRPFGAGGKDVPVSGDFFGEGRTDIGVYRPSTGQWFIERASAGYALEQLYPFGGASDLPAPADYYGNGRTYQGVFRPSTGEWFVAGQATPTTVVPARAGDIPVPGNYDNTGKAELAIYRPLTGQWIIQGPASRGTYSVFFGAAGSGDVPVPGNYFAASGNPSTQLGIYRPSTGQFFVRSPGGGGTAYQFSTGDVPAPADYEGTGQTEPAVFRPSTGQWLVFGPNDNPRGTPRVLTQFGDGTFVPVLAPLSYRGLGGVRAFSAGTAAGLDLGSTARSFTAGPVAPAPASVSASRPAVPAAFTRARPSQSVQAPAAPSVRVLSDFSASKKGRA